MRYLIPDWAWTFLAALVAAAVVALLISGFSAAFGALFWVLWGYVAVPVFHAPALSFFQAWACWVLVCLVGGAFRATVNAARRPER